MSDHTDELDLSRAEQAARDYFADRAAGVGFSPIDPETLLKARPARRPISWLAAAACLVAALVVVPLALRQSGPIAASPAPTGYTPNWTTTAPSPLSPRFGALSGWVAGEFLIVGGWTQGGPCPPGAMCDMAPPDGRDGARYSPATNSWTPIAEAPAGLGRGYAVGAGIGDTFYAISYTGEGSFWAYHPDEDRWQELAVPPGWGELTGVAGSPVLVTGDEGPAGYRYDPAADAWTPLPAGPLDACPQRQGFSAAAGLVVLAECATHPDSDRRVATLDPATWDWTDPTPLGAVVEGDAVHSAGRLVWPDRLTTASTPYPEGIFDIAAGTWLAVGVTGGPGVLAFRDMAGSTPHLVLDQVGLVAANGRLLDVATGDWVELPDPGSADRWDAVTVAGPTSILDCFGYRYDDEGELPAGAGEFETGCSLLTVG